MGCITPIRHNSVTLAIQDDMVWKTFILNFSCNCVVEAITFRCSMAWLEACQSPTQTKCSGRKHDSGVEKTSFFYLHGTNRKPSGPRKIHEDDLIKISSSNRLA